MARLRRFLARLFAVLRSGRAEADLARELDAHLQLLEDDYAAGGLDRGAARQAARRAFGGQIEQVKERQRDERSIRWLDESWLDLKLGARMLVKYPGLTGVAVIALAVAIGGGATYLEFTTDLMRPALPVPEAERLVGVTQWDTAAGRPDHRVAPRLAVWRERARSLDRIGGVQAFARTLVTPGGRASTVNGAVVSAVAFELMAVAPLHGRPLLESDERTGAAPVAVLGERLWRDRFDAEPAIIGRAVQLGAERFTVVGVMPARFGFPTNHELWVPLDLAALTVPPRTLDAVRVFGRLAPGATAATATAELTALTVPAIGTTRPDAPVADVDVRPYVASLWVGTQDGQVQMRILDAANLVFVALLAVCGVNVATLVFGRIVMREGELTVRTALGASRRRIVAQFFAEGIVLAGLAAAVGLTASFLLLRWARTQWLAGAGAEAQPPFWWNDRLSPETIVYATGLTLTAAVLVGIVPALKATGGAMQTRLKHAASGGSSLRFGGAWTVVIVAQLALTVILLSAVASLAWNVMANEYRGGEVRFAREHVVSFRLELPEASRQARLASTVSALERELATHPAMRAVTYATAFPGQPHSEFFLEFRDIAPIMPLAGPLWVGSTMVSPNYFDQFQAPLVAGRSFTPSDAEQSRPVAIVDETFVRTVLGGRHAIGLWLRQPQNSERPAAGRWLEIVGVVRDVSTRPLKTSEDAVIYQPAAPAAMTPLRVALHTAHGADALVTRVPDLVAAIDPVLRVHETMTLDRVNDEDRIAAAFFLRALVAVSIVALVLASAGVYALLAFTVARRQREIGIRAAIGASRAQILRHLFARAAGQVAAGIFAGAVPSMLIIANGAPEVARGSGAAMAAATLTAVTVFMAVVAGGACVVPARRALAVQPTDALRAE